MHDKSDARSLKPAPASNEDDAAPVEVLIEYRYPGLPAVALYSTPLEPNAIWLMAVLPLDMVIKFEFEVTLKDAKYVGVEPELDMYSSPWLLKSKSPY